MNLKNLTKYFPIGSGINYIDDQEKKPIKERDDENKNLLKMICHTLYAGVSFLIAIKYLSFGIVAGTWTPKQYRKLFERYRIKIKQSEEYKQQIFRTNRYIDTNKDGEISFDEKIEFYKRAGLKEKIRFPELSLNDLERAVKSYKVGNK